MTISSRRLAKIVPFFLVLAAALVIGCGGTDHGSSNDNGTDSSVPIGGNGTGVSGASGSGAASGSGNSGGSTGDVVGTQTSSGSTSGTTGTTGFTGGG